MYVADSTVNVIKEDRIMGFNFEFYSSHFTYKLANKNLVFLNVYRDSLMYYEEKDSSDNILFSGTLRFDKTALHITPDANPIVTDEGEELWVDDTSYFWVADGIWREPLEYGITKVVNFDNGNKTSEHVEITSNCRDLVQISVPKNKYKIDTESGRYRFVQPKKKELERLIIGEWYHPKCHNHIFSDEPLWIYTKEKPTVIENNRPTRSTFKRNNQFEGKRSFSCGTGRTKEDYNPKGEWKITDTGRLQIGINRYEVIYIDDNIMILK
jgi:hypothetical protein